MVGAPRTSTVIGAPQLSLISNGSFEANGGLNSQNSFAGWQTFNSGSGAWYAQSGTSLLGFTVAAPSNGSFSAMTSQGGPGVHILYRDVTVPAAASLSFDVQIRNRAGRFVTPASLLTNVQNQQFRMDVMSTTASLTDVGAGVLRSVYQTRVGDPLLTPYVRVTADLSAFAGQTVRLRFAQVDNQGFFQLGLDNVILVSTDDTAPDVSATITGTLGTNGWYTDDVTVAWTATDGESAITSPPCSPVTIAVATAGTSVSCSATSAGGTSSRTVTVKLDDVVPAVSYSGTTSYSVDQSVSLTCSASDAMSGVASSTCADITGNAYDFDLGANTASATATDKAGNVGTGSVTFTVSVNSSNLCTLVERWVSNRGIANSLCVKLAKGNYAAFRHELSAQSGKHISAASAAILTRLSHSL